MAQSVTNDALWEKLSEIDKKIERLSEIQTSSATTPQKGSDKDEIIAKIEEYAYKLGKKSDTHSDMSKQGVKKLTGDLLMIGEMIACVNDRQQAYFELQKEGKETYLNFILFKVRKTTAAIAILSILVFVLSLFGMKQRNSYALLNEEFLLQETIIKERQAEVDSLRAIKPKGVKKK